MRNSKRGPLGRILLGIATLALLLAVPARAFAFGYEPRTVIINTAIAQIGKSYTWGGSGPNTFDCSGLTQYCYAAAGLSIPHQSGAIWSMCDTVTADKLEPGDLAFRATLPSGSAEPTRASNIHHVAMYVGGGRILEASSESKPIGYNKVSNFKFFGRLKEKYWALADRSYDQPPLLRGDFNGDGRQDLAVYVTLAGTGAEARVMLSDGTNLGPQRAWFQAASGWDWKKTKVASGDFNGDGKGDIVLLYDYGGNNVKLLTFLSDGRGFTRRSAWWTSPAGGWSWARTKLTAGDFNGDGKTDVGMFYDDGKGGSEFWVAKSTGSSFGSPSRWWASGAGTWAAKLTKVAVGDVTGDHRADLLMLYDYGRSGTKLWEFTSTGNGFTSTAAKQWYSAPQATMDWTKAKMTSADLNGDGRSDVVVAYDTGRATTRLITFVSAGAFVSAPRTFWASGTGAWDWELEKLAVGDYDHSGRASVAMLTDDGAARSKAWVFRTNSAGGLASSGLAWDSLTGGLDWNRVK